MLSKHGITIKALQVPDIFIDFILLEFFLVWISLRLSIFVLIKNINR